MRFKSTRQLRTESLEPRMMLATDVLNLREACAASLPGENGEAGYIAGDANRDGVFDQMDIQSVLEAGKYATSQTADWSEGDWTGDEVFDQMDLILALQSWPDKIRLPAGFESEGIELGNGHDFFLGGYSWSGDLTHAGSIYRGNLCTGEGEIISEATGKPLAGLSYDARTDYIYAATGDPGAFAGVFTNRGINVYSASTGDLVDAVNFGDDIQINDVLVTNTGVYGTDSINPALYKIPLDESGQPDSAAWETIEMTGFVMDSAGFGFNANGLVGDFDGTELVVININTGVLYNVDTDSGIALPVEIQGEEQLFIDGDGMYMDGRTLYIMQNFQHKIAVVQLSDDLTQGTFVKTLTSDQFAVPTTITGFGNSIYAINTHFCEITTFCGLEDPADPTTFRSDVVKVDK